MLSVLNLLACGGPNTPVEPMLSAGFHHVCVVWTDGALECHGLDEQGQATVPAGTWSAVAAGDTHTCAISAEDGAISCWGSKEDGRHLPPKGEYVDIAAGEAHTCAIDVDGALACWGSDERGQSTPPSGTFVAVDSGNDRSCAIADDGTVSCWGWQEDGPPAGTFSDVAVGAEHDCGVEDSGSLVCWNESGSLPDAAPPDGSFGAVSAGVGDQSVICHTCALTDAGVDCWGACDSYDGPGDVAMRSLDSGEGYHCGITEADAQLVCWGSNGTIRDAASSF
ncbi:MAG: hypothetical protein GY884_08130 [Proteobacteria bacterium]|nr:hypothetical protein [Pseudomonadota bacterium]